MNRGSSNVQGRIAYVGQEVVIFQGTIRENILFGKDFDEERYSKSIEVSCFQQDLQLLPEKDLTVVGDRGVKLSGGQQIRLALARALYSDSDIYLLDDPLSAVDPEVRALLLQNYIQNALSQKIVVLCTHHEIAVRYSDKVCILDNGFMSFQGSTQEYLEYTGKTIQTIQDIKTDHQVKSFAEKNIQQQENVEEADTGKVPLSLYYKFLMEFYKFGIFFFFMVLLFSLDMFTNILTQQWLTEWSQEYDQRQNENTTTFALLAFGGVVLDIIANSLFAVGVIYSSKYVFIKGLKGLLQTGLSYFNNQPIGRIVNRMSRDVAVVDAQLCWFLTLGFNLIFQMISAYIYMIIVIPLNAIFALFLFPTLFLLWRYIVPISNDIRRQELIYKSPVYQSFTNAIVGVTDIRCYNQQKHFQDKWMQIFSNTYLVTFNSQGVIEFFTTLCSLCAALICGLNVLLVVLLKNEISLGLAASSVIVAASRSQLFQFSTWFLVQADNAMCSPQRLYNYAELEPEKNTDDEQLKDTQGKIQFQNVYMSYTNNENYQIQDMSFVIPAGVKCGIVGRTGSGKSTIVNLLFKLYDYQLGQILIDGIEIKNLSVQTLRNALTVIPQNPFLFQGSLKTNIDPLDLYSEDQINQALKKASLDYLIDQEVEGDLQLSSGEKQLLSLARAVLKHSKVLVLDEATSNVDFETDAIIQKVIRQEFYDATIITIAHRIDSIMDYDQVIVINEGRVIEQGKISELEADISSKFYEMLEASKI